MEVIAGKASTAVSGGNLRRPLVGYTLLPLRSFLSEYPAYPARTFSIPRREARLERPHHLANHHAVVPTHIC